MFSLSPILVILLVKKSAKAFADAAGGSLEGYSLSHSEPLSQTLFKIKFRYVYRETLVRFFTEIQIRII